MDRIEAELEFFLEDVSSEGFATEEHLASVEQRYECLLPKDYRTLMLRRNGGEGFVGEQYVILWKAAELVPFNREYEVERYAPGLLFFGSNGGGEGFGFDIRNKDMPIVMVPFIGMSLDSAKQLGTTFLQFLQKISDGLD